MTSVKRQGVEREQVGVGRWGPVYVLRITYTDGRVSYGSSGGGVLSLFGPDGEAEARRHATEAVEDRR